MTSKRILVDLSPDSIMQIMLFCDSNVLNQFVCSCRVVYEVFLQRLPIHVKDVRLSYMNNEANPSSALSSVFKERPIFSLFDNINAFLLPTAKEETLSCNNEEKFLELFFNPINNKNSKVKNVPRIIMEEVFKFNKSLSKDKFYVAGGYLLQVLMKTSPKRDSWRFPMNDIDIFLIGTSSVEKKRELYNSLFASISKVLSEKMCKHGYAVVKTNVSLTVYSDASSAENLRYSPQFLLYDVPTIEMFFAIRVDLDCTKFVYDGNKVYTNEDGFRFINTKMNFYDCNYGTLEHCRLVKYFCRYNIATVLNRKLVNIHPLNKYYDLKDRVKYLKSLGPDESDYRCDLDDWKDWNFLFSKGLGDYKNECMNLNKYMEKNHLQVSDLKKYVAEKHCSMLEIPEEYFYLCSVHDSLEALQKIDLTPPEDGPLTLFHFFNIVQCPICWKYHTVKYYPEEDWQSEGREWEASDPLGYGIPVKKSTEKVYYEVNAHRLFCLSENNDLLSDITGSYKIDQKTGDVLGRVEDGKKWQFIQTPIDASSGKIIIICNQRYREFKRISPAGALEMSLVRDSRFSTRAKDLEQLQDGERESRRLTTKKQEYFGKNISPCCSGKAKLPKGQAILLIGIIDELMERTALELSRENNVVVACLNPHNSRRRCKEKDTTSIRWTFVDVTDESSVKDCFEYAFQVHGKKLDYVVLNQAANGMKIPTYVEKWKLILFDFDRFFKSSLGVVHKTLTEFVRKMKINETKAIFIKGKVTRRLEFGFHMELNKIIKEAAEADMKFCLGEKANSLSVDTINVDQYWKLFNVLGHFPSDVVNGFIMKMF